MKISLPDLPRNDEIREKVIFCWYPRVFEFEDLVIDRALIWLEFVRVSYHYQFVGHKKYKKNLESYQIVGFKDYWKSLYE